MKTSMNTASNTWITQETNHTQPLHHHRRSELTRAKGQPPCTALIRSPTSCSPPLQQTPPSRRRVRIIRRPNQTPTVRSGPAGPYKYPAHALPPISPLSVFFPQISHRLVSSSPRAPPIRRQSAAESGESGGGTGAARRFGRGGGAGRCGSSSGSTDLAAWNGSSTRFLRRRAVAGGGRGRGRERDGICV